MNPESPQKGLLIPMEKLSQEALNGLIQEFILREGTDYGQKEYSLQEKIDQIHKQLKLGHISILFDPILENTTLIKKETLIKLGQQNFEILS